MSGEEASAAAAADPKSGVGVTLDATGMILVAVALGFVASGIYLAQWGIAACVLALLASGGGAGKPSDGPQPYTNLERIVDWLMPMVVGAAPVNLRQLIARGADRLSEIGRRFPDGQPACDRPVEALRCSERLSPQPDGLVSGDGFSGCRAVTACTWLAR
jgi:hypothetical protein